MELRDFLEQTSQRQIALNELVTVAADRAAAGDDIVAAFRSQIEQRSRAAQSVLDGAERAGRDSLLADEQRSYNAATRERDEILRLQRAVEERTEQRNHVPVSQRIETKGAERRGLFGIEMRALVGTSGAGDVVTPPEYAGSMFDMLAAAAVGFRAGFRRILTDRDKLIIPAITSDPTVANFAQGVAITASDPGYAAVTAEPRKMAALVALANEVISDSNPSVLQVLEQQLARALALRIDQQSFNGTGAANNQFVALKDVSGISTESMGANGAALASLDPFASAIAKLEAENAEASAILMAPRTWGSLLRLKEAPTGSNKSLMQDSAGSGADGVRRAIFGVPVFLTSSIPTNETQGSSGAVASSAYVVQADQVVIVMRQDARLQLDSSRLFNSDQSELRATLRADMVVPNPKAICRILGILA